MDYLLTSYLLAIRTKAGSSDDDMILVIIFLAIAGVSFVIYLAAQGTKQKSQTNYLLQKEAKNREFFRKYIESIPGDQLPAVQTNILLKAGECAYYHQLAALYEERSVRQYQSGMGGIRIAKGVWIGGSQGQSSSIPELKEIDTGMLTVTNLRIVFSGIRQSRSIAIIKIISISQGMDAIQLSVEGRQKNLIFTADNPYFLNLALQYVTGAIREDNSAN